MKSPPGSVIHINFIAGPLVFDARPIWTAAREAENQGKLPKTLASRLFNNLGGTAIHLGTRHYVMKRATEELKSALQDIYNLVPEPWSIPNSHGFRVVSGEACERARDRVLLARSRYGTTLAEVIGNDFRVSAPDVPRCRLRLVRVGAVCDHAQGRTGPIPYLMGLEIPTALVRNKKASDAEWRSPILALVQNEGPFRLHVNSRHLITSTGTQVDTWPVSYRLREQLLMDLVNHAAGYVSRPGIVFTGKR